jgi:hypothetical protein
VAGMSLILVQQLTSIVVMLLVVLTLFLGLRLTRPPGR